ncbi:ATP12 family protein [Roseicyclus sp. F158]|uniref:ATP12 family protein n=1 Tax=Tropicimonas omnivorans TaxID=3075590 RepID=A0ABU3DEY5_9RHOB|nr:ATP12 family protein [Roseicyclus sp. F158]MDT0682281.1 ATP12 family protein [Roseicyclus sp. F158]
MSEWRAKRFWTTSSVEAETAGFRVELDGRPIRTPAKQLLVLPSEALARAVAAEWDVQADVIDPGTMPVTRAANAALDKVASNRDGLIEGLASYGATDLLCYRAEEDDPLRALQDEAWDPLLNWAEASFGVALVPTCGVVPVDQDAASLSRLSAILEQQDDFSLTALSELVSLSGSLVIGLAVIEGLLPDEELWRRSRVDEDWQESQWGRDEEAAETAALKRGEFLRAAEFYRLSRPGA